MPSKPQSWVLIIVTNHRRPWRSQSVAGPSVHYSGRDEDKKGSSVALFFFSEMFNSV